jgi:predicted nucleic-acid-binding protein
MIGVDSNILLRAIAADDPVQKVKATRFLAEECTKSDPGFVNLVVLSELVWTLDKGYGYDREQIADVIEALVTTTELAVERRDDVVSALARYREVNVGFADILIATVNSRHGCSETVTFDRKAAKLDGFRLLT